MNVALWIIASVLAFGFIAGSIVKLTWSHERYAAKLRWPADFTAAQVKLIGVIELLGGIGLVVPAALDAARVLVPIAASGMALYMAGAVTERVRRREHKEMIGDLLFVAGLVFVSWGRFGLEPWV